MTPEQAVAQLVARISAPPPNRSNFRFIKQDVNAAVANLCRTVGAVNMTVTIHDATGHSQKLNAQSSGTPDELHGWRTCIFKFLPRFAATYGFRRVQVSLAFANGFTCTRVWPAPH